jgi:hypothetical protein
MLVKSFKRSLLAVLAIASVSNADQFGIGIGIGIGGDQHHLCDNPYDPNCGPGGQPGYPGHPGYDDDDQGHHDGREVKRIYIGRSVRNEVLNLRQLSGVGVQYRGWEVLAVRARTRPNSPHQTTVQLLADGYVVDTQTNPGDRIRLKPNRRLVIGSSVRELEMWISGSTFIEEISVVVRPTQSAPNHPQPPTYPDYPNHPQPPTYPDYPNHPGNPGHGEERLDLWIGRSVYGNDSVDLLAYVDMYRYRGRRIQKVIVEADPQHNVALADVLVNGWSAGTLQFDNSHRAQSVRLSGQPDIGGAASSLVLRTRGNMLVERVTLVLR